MNRAFVGFESDKYEVASALSLYWMASLPDHRATFRVAFHTMGPRLPAKQIGPISGRGSLKYVTEYVKRVLSENTTMPTRKALEFEVQKSA